MKPKHNESQITAGAERREVIVRLRAEGRTFKVIAAELGVSPSRASQLYNRAIRLRRSGASIEGAAIVPNTSIDSLPLSLRTAAALRSAGYATLAEVIPFDAAMERQLLQLPNFGRPCLDEMRAVIHSMEKNES